MALGNYAALLSKTGDYAESKAAYEEMLAIRQKYFPPETLNTADAMIGYATLLRDMGAYEAIARPTSCAGWRFRRKRPARIT